MEYLETGGLLVTLDGFTEKNPLSKDLKKVRVGKIEGGRR